MASNCARKIAVMLKTQTPNVKYTAYFVDDQKALLRNIPPRLTGKDVRIHAHHVTKEYRPKNGVDGIILGQKKIMYAFAQVITDRVHTVLVKDKNGQEIFNNAYPHITIATARGAQQKESNEAIAEAYKQNTVLPLDPVIEVPVTEGYFDITSVYNK
jgi:hypothetical protein